VNTGRTLWISSEEVSMNSEPNPRAQMSRGKFRHDAGNALGETGFTDAALIWRSPYAAGSCAE
jgi:hypothetical protein